MYKIVGYKIQILAQVLGVLFLLAGVIIGIVLFVDDGEVNITGVVSIVTGILMFLLSFPLYGFGKLVEDVSAIRNNLQSAAKPGYSTYDELPEL